MCAYRSSAVHYELISNRRRRAYVREGIVQRQHSEETADVFFPQRRDGFRRPHLYSHVTASELSKKQRPSAYASKLTFPIEDLHTRLWESCMNFAVHIFYRKDSQLHSKLGSLIVNSSIVKVSIMILKFFCHLKLHSAISHSLHNSISVLTGVLFNVDAKSPFTKIEIFVKTRIYLYFRSLRVLSMLEKEHKLWTNRKKTVLLTSNGIAETVQQAKRDYVAWSDKLNEMKRTLDDCISEDQNIKAEKFRLNEKEKMSKYEEGDLIKRSYELQNELDFESKCCADTLRAVGIQINSRNKIIQADTVGQPRLLRCQLAMKENDLEILQCKNNRFRGFGKNIQNQIEKDVKRLISMRNVLYILLENIKDVRQTILDYNSYSTKRPNWNDYYWIQKVLSVLNGNFKIEDGRFVGSISHLDDMLSNLKQYRTLRLGILKKHDVIAFTERAKESTQSVDRAIGAQIKILRHYDQLDSYNEKVEEVISADEIPRIQININEEQQQAFKYFLGLGSSSDIPKFLRFQGKVRNRNLGRIDLQVLIDMIWKEFEKLTDCDSVKCNLQECLYEFLKKRFGIQTIIAEWGYNIMHALEKWVSDAEVELFLLVLTGNLSVCAYKDQKEMIASMQSWMNTLSSSSFHSRGHIAMRKFGKSLNKKPSTNVQGTVHINTVSRNISFFFPSASQQDIDIMVSCLNIDFPAGNFNTNSLYDKSNGEGRKFLQYVRKFHMKKFEDFIQDVDNKMRMAQKERKKYLTDKDILYVLKECDSKFANETWKHYYKFIYPNEESLDQSLSADEVMARLMPILKPSGIYLSVVDTNIKYKAPRFGTDVATSTVDDIVGSDSRNENEKVDDDKPVPLSSETMNKSQQQKLSHKEVEGNITKSFASYNAPCRQPANNSPCIFVDPGVTIPKMIPLLSSPFKRYVKVKREKRRRQITEERGFDALW